MQTSLTKLAVPLLVLGFQLSMAAAEEPQKPTDKDQWTQWRGPERDGTIQAPAWPDNLKEATLKESWSAEQPGPSYSGPIVSADKVFTTATVDKAREVVVAYERKRGKKLWAAEWDGAITVPFFAAKNGSWIRATPALDGDTLYVAGIRDQLVAINTEDGSIRWTVDFVKEFSSPSPTFGFVSSPVIHGDSVYVQAGGGVVKVDKKTGKVVWRVLNDGGGMMGSAFASPMVAEVSGQEMLLVLTRKLMAGVDLDEGKIFWQRDIPAYRGMNILTPVVHDKNSLLTSTYSGSTQLFKVETSAHEYRTEDGWTTRYAGYMCTPVVVEGHAYFLGQDQRAICIDLSNGEEKWRSEKRFGQYWSMVANGDKLLALDQKGILYLIKADPKEFTQLDERKVAEAETWAHIAMAGSDVVIRDLNKLTVWNWSPASR